MRAIVARIALVILAQSAVSIKSQTPLGNSSNQTRNCEAASPARKIATLSVRITTRNTRGAGTDLAVYFDVGPWAWRLNNSRHNDFERGHTDTFELPVPDGFRVSDILWLRLHKKGLIGVTGTRDGFTGAWHPTRIILLVNGVEYANGEITSPLNSEYWFWTKLTDVDPYGDPLNFGRSLRLSPNEELPWVARVTGFLTTPLFKRRGISGWLNCPEQKQKSSNGSPCARVPEILCATGTVHREPAKSNDGLATIDLIVDELEFCSTKICGFRAQLRQLEEPRRMRYLRVEYRYRKHRVPQRSDLVRICGKPRWDTDREGWWEIHPRNWRDVYFR